MQEGRGARAARRVASGGAAWRGGRAVLWAAVVLLLLAGAFLAALFCWAAWYPWERYERAVRDLLSRGLPVEVRFAKPAVAWTLGLGITFRDFRVLARGREEAEGEILAAHALVVRPSLSALLKREVRLRMVLESPSVNLRQAGLLGMPEAEEALAEASPPPGRLSELVSLPAGFSLTELDLRVANGTVYSGVPGGPGPATSTGQVREIGGAFLLRDDLSFRTHIRNGVVHWRSGGERPREASGRLSGRIEGRVLDEGGWRAEGAVRFLGAAVRFPERELGVPSPLDLSVSLAEGRQGSLSVKGLRVEGPGLLLRAEAGAAGWNGSGPEISLQGLQAELSDLRPLLAALPRGTELEAACAVTAGAVSWGPSRPDTPAFPAASFHLRIPGNLSLEGFRVQVSGGRFRLAPRDGVRRVELGGLQAVLEQEGAGRWTGRVEASSSEFLVHAPAREEPENDPGDRTAGDAPAPTGRAGGLRWDGPFDLRVQWAETADSSRAVVVADLTGGRVRYGNLLDKQAGVRLQAGGRARFAPGEIQVGRAFLELGETSWEASGSLKGPGDPVLDAELASGRVSLEQVAGFSPAAADHAARGVVEIRRAHLTGRTRAMRETASVRVRVAGKGLEYERVALEQAYAEAVYGNQFLTVSPLVVVPGTGSRVEATFSGDLSGGAPVQGRHRYYGTVRMEKVDLDEIVTVARPEYRGRVSGTVDANAAGRGSGETWSEVRKSLEARARVSVHDFEIHGDAGRKLVETLAPGEATGVDLQGLDREHRRLLSGNSASGLVSLMNEKVHVRNLAATYEGKVVEMDGSLDFSGRLHVDRGSLFLKNRHVPFRLSCRIGEGKCLPAPDLKSMGTSAAREVVAGLHTLSAGSRDVFKDLFF